MEPATFPINSYSGIVQVINYLNNNHSKAAAEGKPLVVRINQKEDDRSAAQNRLYWAWLEQIKQKTGNSKDDLHLLFKKKFLARIYVEGRQETAEKYMALQNFKDVIQAFDGPKRRQLERITKFWSIPSLKTICKARRPPLKNSPNIWIRSTSMHIETWA